MYEWPVDAVVAKLDTPVKKLDSGKFRKGVVDQGYGESLAQFLSQLYERANGGTFYDGAFRIIPVEGSEDDQMPGLLEWNEPGSWKSYGPRGSESVFYFCMNSFGDQFGIPLDENGEIARNRTSVLWVEKSVYEESSLEWGEILLKLLSNESDMATYLARLKEHEWARGFLGEPSRWECFSWDLPPILGGPDDIDNLKIVPAPVHVSFTLQVIKQSREGQ